MKFLLVLFSCLVLLPELSFAGEPVREEEARLFFRHYRKMWNQHNPHLTALYSDSATIILAKVSTSGLYLYDEIPGKEYKAMLPALLTRRKENKRAYRFNDVKFSKNGRNYNIKTIRDPGDGTEPIPLLLTVTKNSKGKLVLIRQQADLFSHQFYE